MFGYEGSGLFLGILPNVTKFGDPFVKWGVGGGRWYRVMEMIRDGLYYRMCLPVGVMFYSINDFAYKVICG